MGWRLEFELPWHQDFVFDRNVDFIIFGVVKNRREEPGRARYMIYLSNGTCGFRVRE